MGEVAQQPTISQQSTIIMEILSSEREKTLSSEENDILQRSNKKFKRQIEEVNGEVEMESPPAYSSPGGTRKSYSQMAQSYGKAVNPLFEGSGEDEDSISDDDQATNEENDDEDCPNILLSKEDKRHIRGPWRNAIIIKLFDKKMGYEALMRRLKFKWSLKGAIALTDVGHAYYVVRFTNYEDYEFVMTQGPWMIGDSYLTIRKWVPNFVADEAPMRHLTAWVRIPNLSVEYFDKQVLHKIGARIGKVIKIDRNTESMDRGQYVRFCIEVDLSKPLLSKFRLNGKIWRIQYEGLRMICFKCGLLGHKEEVCGKRLDACSEGGGVGEPKIPSVREVEASHQSSNVVQHQKPEENSKYGEWMLVSRPIRRGLPKHAGDQRVKDSPIHRGGLGGGRPNNGSKTNPSSHMIIQRAEMPKGSRFEVLGPESMDVTVGENEDGKEPVNATVDQVGQENGQGTNSGGPIDPILLETCVEKILPSNEGASTEGGLPQDKAVVKDRQNLGKESKRISLENISLYSKDKDLKKIGFRTSGSNLRVNMETASRVSLPRNPKFKKGSTRKNNLLRAVGKENIPVSGLSVVKVQSASEKQPTIPIPDVGLVTPKPPDNTGVPHPSGSGVLCGELERGSVDDSNSPNGESGPDGIQFIPAPGELSSVPNDVNRLAVHHRWTNEGSERDVSCNDA